LVLAEWQLMQGLFVFRCCHELWVSIWVEFAVWMAPSYVEPSVLLLNAHGRRLPSKLSEEIAFACNP
jgi:hypothetical protein